MVSDLKRKESSIAELPRSARRAIAVASLLGLPGMYAWSAFWLGTSASKLLWGPISFLLVGVSAGGALVLYLFVRDRADMRADLDERQRQLRDQALVLAYQTLSGAVVLAVAVVAVWVLGFGRSIRLDATVVGAMAISIGVLIPLLPTAALAWIEPDAPPDA